MSRFEYRNAKKEDVQKIVDLMHEVFPSSTLYTVDYLNWLYWKNPVGDAVSFNAWDGDRLVGHLAAIPQRVILHAKPTTVTLLLNVATAASARGKGLFLDLVRELERFSAQQGHSAVIGVANQQTYRAYVQKLGFQDVVGLGAHVEFASYHIDFHRALERAELWHDWDCETLAWRMANPCNPLSVVDISTSSITIEGASTLSAIRARAIIPRRGLDFDCGIRSYAPAVVLGLSPRGTVRRRFALDIPDRFKPSPLRLVYRNLFDPADRLDPNEILFSFLDFDAF